MAEWYEYPDKNSLKNFDAESKDIIEVLGLLQSSGFDKNSTGGKTNDIKYALIKAGYELGFCVYSCMQKSKSKDALTKVAHDTLIDDRKKEIKKLIESLKKRDKKKYNFNNHSFNNHEWLYDLHWYKDNPNTDYMPKILPLVAEFELGNKRALDNGEYCKQPYSAVRFDFQKLLVANADLLLIVFAVTDFDRDVLLPDTGLDVYFEDAIKRYDNLNGKYNFLFACYAKNTLHFAHILGNKN